MKPIIISNRLIRNGIFLDGLQELEEFLINVPEDTMLVFAFWSWKVPNHILANYRCYNLHTGPLLDGKGKGGSPIDNLKQLGVKWTTLCAHDMTERFDEGKVHVAIPIYISRPKLHVIEDIDAMLPDIVEYLMQRLSDEHHQIPEIFKRLPNVK